MSLLRSVFGPSKDELWEQLAADIGGKYEDGGFLGEDVLRYQAGNWEISLDSYTASEGDLTATLTRMRAPFVNKDGLRFKVCRQGPLASFEKALGLQDIEIGDEYFDSNYLIKGNNDEKVKLLLKSPQLKALIEQQPDINFEIRNDDGWFGAKFPDGVDELYFECYGLLTDEEQLKALFDLFSTALERLVQIDSAYEDDPGVEL